MQLHPEVAAWLVERGKLDRFGAEPLFTNPNAQNNERRWKEGSERRVLVKAYAAAGIAYIKPNEMSRHFFGTHFEADIYPAAIRLPPQGGSLIDIVELGAIGELVGAVAVIATLIYLAVQIRHGTESNLASTQSGIQSEYHRLHEMVISGPELVRILERVARL